MNDLTSAERRITLRLLSYWEKLRRDRPMPEEEDIKPDDIGDLWDSCFLIHVRDIGLPDQQYRYLGDAIADAYRHGLPAVEPQTPVAPSAGSIADGYYKVIASRKPLMEDGEFRNAHNEIVRYRQCLLPLGEGDEVKAIFGGMRFKIFPA